MAMHFPSVNKRICPSATPANSSKNSCDDKKLSIQQNFGKKTTLERCPILYGRLP